MENNTYRWSAAGGSNDFDWKKLLKIGAVVAVLVAVVVAGFTCFYTVDDKQQAVVTTFGKVTDITDPGLHFKAPFGIQKVKKVDVNVYQKIEIGYETDGYGNEIVKTNESAMITGDYNIVNVDFFVEYKISDPEQYLYSSTSPELILRNLIQSQIRNVVGSASVDSVLTDGKESIQMRVKELVTQILADYDIGLTLVDVRIQDAEPPTVAVIEAFKAVETAKQQAQAVVNDSIAYENAQLPAADAKVDKLLREAEYQKTARINEGVQQVAMFTAMYEQYAKDPDITTARMYYETVSKILPGVKLYINTGSGEGNDVQMLLPLESLMGGN
ncbi:MAG: FtsH protease activity modulator HflK [Oscillospiraceae bacterium]|nr:FtsH protease activity modulator HflK [Oscillospiraceae bacterium]MBQ2384547.1 FtsH protease activity modulator HflK [Oscillospiraceae bacterium]MBQ5712837.1 FtsH protease activity modulator HflK [Oscillospiraceae bacterium]